jgi:heat shock protein HtpX
VELRAVLAHELSHICNGDAALMTILAGPPIWVLRGLMRAWYAGGDGGGIVAVRLNLLVWGSFTLMLVALPAWVSRFVSRYRELAADRGAAVLTGTPSALAAVLLRLSDRMSDIPKTDLRLVGVGDPFHLLPAMQREEHGIRRLWATHPSLQTRVKRLERMESRLQSARPSRSVG